MSTTDLRRLGAKRMRLEADERAVADQLRPLIADALRGGMRPAEACELTGWSPAQIRIIARAAGVGPAPRGPRPKAGRSDNLRRTATGDQPWQSPS